MFQNATHILESTYLTGQTIWYSSDDVRQERIPSFPGHAGGVIARSLMAICESSVGANEAGPGSHTLSQIKSHAQFGYMK